MERTCIEDEVFSKIDFVQNLLPKNDYENCTFLNCDFSNTDLSGIIFLDCTFTSCNLSMANLTKTAFKDIVFDDCKMLGLDFGLCSEFLFLVGFKNCILNFSSFYKRKLKKSKFVNTSLQEVDFTEADLSGAVLDDCDLAGATFDNTVLEKADLRTSYHYSIDPDLNRIKKAKFSLQGVVGLLHKFEIVVE